MKFSALLESEQIIEVIERIRNRNIELHLDGCISLLDDEDNIWITPDQFDETSLSIDDIVFVSKEGEIEENKVPSKYLALHRSIYQKNRNVRAVCHVFSPAFSKLGDEFNYGILNSLPNISKLVGTVAIEDLGRANDDEWIESITNHFEGFRATIIFKGTGMLVSGPSLHNVFHKVENIEKLSCTYLKSKKLGSLKRPNIEAVETVKEYEAGPFVGLRGRKSYTDFSSFHAELLRLAKYSYQKQWVTASTGSFSVRADADSFFINPADVDRKYLVSDDLVYIKKDKVEANKIPEERVWVHRTMYEQNPKIHAIAFIFPDDLGAYCIINSETALDLSDGKMVKLGLEKVFDGETLTVESKGARNGIFIENDAFLSVGKNADTVIKKIESAMQKLTVD
jgi:L-fuculose-phosphate aldolase